MADDPEWQESHLTVRDRAVDVRQPTGRDTTRTPLTIQKLEDGATRNVMGSSDGQGMTNVDPIYRPKLRRFSRARFSSASGGNGQPIVA